MILGRVVTCWPRVLAMRKKLARGEACENCGRRTCNLAPLGCWDRFSESIRLRPGAPVELLPDLLYELPPSLRPLSTGELFG